MSQVYDRGPLQGQPLRSGAPVFGAYCPDAEAADHAELRQAQAFEDIAPSPVDWQMPRPMGTGRRFVIMSAIAAVLLAVVLVLS